MTTEKCATCGAPLPLGPPCNCCHGAPPFSKPMLRDLLTSFGQAYHKLLTEGGQHSASVDAAESAINELLHATPQAPIAKVIVREDDSLAVSLYAPGLPPGEFDLFCDPEAVAPYLRARETKAKPVNLPVRSVSCSRCQRAMIATADAPFEIISIGCDRADCPGDVVKTNSLDMSDQPMGDPHPCDLTRAGCDPVTGRKEKAGAALWPAEREELIRWHRHCAKGCLQQDDFNGQRQHEMRAEELERNSQKTNGEPASKEAAYRETLVDIRHRLRSDPPDFETAVIKVRGIYTVANEVLMANGDGFASPRDVSALPSYKHVKGILRDDWKAPADGPEKSDA